MRERRAYERKHLIQCLPVFDRATNTPLGNLVDISPEGIKLVCPHPLDAPTEYRLRVELPTDAFRQAFLDFDARVMWCMQTQNATGFAAGFHFQEIGKEEMDTLTGLMADFCASPN